MLVCVSLLPVFVLHTRIFSMSDMLESSSSIFDILMSSVMPEIVDFSSASDGGILDSPISFVVLSFTLPKVESVSVSSFGMKVLDTITSLGLMNSFVIREMST